MTVGIVAAYQEAMAQGALRAREELGTSAAPGDGEEVPQHGATETKDPNCTEDVDRPLTGDDGSSRMVKAVRVDVEMVDPGCVEDVPQVH